MSDFTTTNWMSKIATDPILSSWEWQDSNGLTQSLGDYTIGAGYKHDNKTNVTLISKSGFKSKHKKKRKKKSDKK